MKLRKWNRIIHRDLGYIFFGMSIIYGLSGIALNHIGDWNPDYIIKHAVENYGYARPDQKIIQFVQVDTSAVHPENADSD